MISRSLWPRLVDLSEPVQPNFVRLGLAFSAAWGLHLCSKLPFGADWDSLLDSSFRRALLRFGEIFDQLAATNSSRGWVEQRRLSSDSALAEWNKLAEDNLEVWFGEPILTRASLWFEELTGLEWPAAWGNRSIGFTGTPQLESLWKLAASLCDACGTPRVELELGALLGVAWLVRHSLMCGPDGMSTDGGALREHLRSSAILAGWIKEDTVAGTELPGSRAAFDKLWGIVYPAAQGCSEFKRTTAATLHSTTEPEWINLYQAMTMRDIVKHKNISLGSVQNLSENGEEFENHPKVRKFKITRPGKADKVTTYVLTRWLNSKH